MIEIEIERESSARREAKKKRKTEKLGVKELGGETAGADRVYAPYDWLDESIVDPLSRSRVVGELLLH